MVGQEVRRSALDGHIRLSSDTLLERSERTREFGPTDEQAAERSARELARQVAEGTDVSREPRKRYSQEVMDFSPRAMLQIWAARIQGKNLTDPLTPSVGGDARDEVEGQVVEYVKSTAGYWQAEPVLKWEFVKGRDALEFDLRRPGESFDYALGRFGLDPAYQEYKAFPYKLGPRLRDEFVRALQERLASDPFVFVCELPEEDQGLVTEGERAQWDALHKKAKKGESKREAQS